MTKRILIPLAFLACVTGGVQPVTASDSTHLDANEGIIVYRLNCGPGIAWGQIFRSGESSKSVTAESRRTGLLSCKAGEQTHRLKAGRYFVGRVGQGGTVAFSEEAAMQFEVAAGKLNYIGHITLPSSLDSGKLLISDPFVRDQHDEALAWLAANDPALSQQYEFVTALAQSASKPAPSDIVEQNGPGSATEFTVVLKLRVAANGSVREGRIAKSSGNASLDQTALSEAVRNWRLTPTSEGGTSVETWGDYSVTYRRAH